MAGSQVISCSVLQWQGGRRFNDIVSLKYLIHRAVTGDGIIYISTNVWHNRWLSLSLWVMTDTELSFEYFDPESPLQTNCLKRIKAVYD